MDYETLKSILILFIKVLVVLAMLRFLYFLIQPELMYETKSTETSSDVFKTIVDMETVAKSKENYWEVLVDKKTGILYLHDDGQYCTGITPLYHSDGSFKLYNEYFDESGRIKEDIKEEITGG